MSARTAVFHNGYNFDHIVMQQHGISLANVNLEDTLLAHHAFASHLPKRLDHVVGVFLDSGPWKIKFGRRGAEEKGLAPVHMPPEELASYNASDARLTALAWEQMQADLVDERAIYEHDKQIAVITRQMQMDGIGFDVERKMALTTKLVTRADAQRDVIRTMLAWPEFEPAKLAHVRQALFQRCNAPVFAVSAKTGLPSTSSATLESLRAPDTNAGIFADAMLLWRAVTKMKTTYLDPINPLEDGRVHYNWRGYGAVSGRWSCRFQSIPRFDTTIGCTPRECYIAESGNELQYFDLSQSEMRAAAFLSGDKNFIESCKGDVHSNNAKILFPKASAAGWLEGGPKCDLCKKDVRHTKGCSNPKGNPWLGKPFRDIAKNAGFGILYSAKTDTIFSFLRAKGFAVTMAQVQAMFDQIRQTYRGYYNYCADNLFQCNMKGFLRTELLGRIRWIGFYPAEGDPYNFTVQSFIADLMNLRLIELVRRTRGLGVRIVAQMHDALAVEVRKGKRARLCAEAIRQIWAEPIKILRNGLEMVMPIDFKVAERISDFG